MSRIISERISETDKLIKKALLKRLGLKKKVGEIPSITQIRIVNYLLKNNNSAYQKDLESVLKLRRATVSGVLKTMEKNKTIERAICMDDSRAKKIVLTSESILFFEDANKKAYELDSIVKNGITEEEMKIFVSVLERINNNLSQEV